LKAKLQTEFDILLFAAVPGWFPFGVELTKLNQMIVMPQLTLDDVPKVLCSFDQPSRIISEKDTAVHFFVHDRKFRNVIMNPQMYVGKFMNLGAILTPDLTLTVEMPRWVRIQRTHLSRCVGAYFLSRQLNVIPTLRWVELSDLDFVAEGIPQESVFAVGAYGNFRNPQSRWIFETGLIELIDILNPVGVLIYGPIRDEVAARLAKKTRLFTFAHPMTDKNQNLNRQETRNSLFVA
jgi:hypothetical protein